MLGKTRIYEKRMSGKSGLFRYRHLLNYVSTPTSWQGIVLTVLTLLTITAEALVLIPFTVPERK